MTRIKNMKGFTLIELVVVIVIIGILAAIAAFAYVSVVNNSKKTDVQTAATQLAKSYAANLQFSGATTASAAAAATSDLPTGSGYVANANAGITALAISKAGYCAVVNAADLTNGYSAAAVGTVQEAPNDVATAGACA